jgi:hypothetical protein
MGELVRYILFRERMFDVRTNSRNDRDGENGAPGFLSRDQGRVWETDGGSFSINRSASSRKAFASSWLLRGKGFRTNPRQGDGMSPGRRVRQATGPFWGRESGRDGATLFQL